MAVPLLLNVSLSRQISKRSVTNAKRKGIRTNSEPWPDRNGSPLKTVKHVRITVLTFLASVNYASTRQQI